MARKTTKTRTAARTPTPSAAFRDFTNAARSALMQRIEGGRRLAQDKVSEAREAASQLEKVFEQRVSRAISRLGVPTSRDVRVLAREVADLKASVEQLRRARAR